MVKSVWRTGKGSGDLGLHLFVRSRILAEVDCQAEH